MTGFLTNHDIRQMYAAGQTPIRLTGHDDKTRIEDLALRPAKFDLRIGQIHPPGTPVGQRKQYHVLKARGVALVETLEDIHLPDSIMGMMFPKSGEVAQRGLLITNFGHVDPGYKGKLTYTVINMSSEDFELRHGDALACLMLYSFDHSADPAWRGSAPNLSELAQLNRMTGDFMDLSARMDRTAKEVVRDRVNEIVNPTLMATILASVVGSIVSMLAVALAVMQIGTPQEQAMALKVTHLEEQMSAKDIDSRLEHLESAVRTGQNSAEFQRGRHRP